MTQPLSLTGTRLINMPSGFRATRFGGWCSPLGVFYPRMSNISSSPILRSRGLQIPSYDERWESIDLYAIYNGWFEVTYWQRKMTDHRNFDESSNAKRKIHFNYCGQAIDRKQQRRILDVGRFFLSRFSQGSTKLVSNNYIFNNIDLPGLMYRPPPMGAEAWNIPAEYRISTKTAISYPFFRLDIQKAYEKLQRVA